MESTTTNIGLIALVPCILGVVFLAVGVLAAIFALRSRQKASASQQWPTVGGQVRSARVQEHVSTDLEEGHQVTYTPEVEYAYTVNGQEYVGRRITFGATDSTRKGAEAAVAKYAPLAAVTVHYNLANPQEGVLEAKAGGSSCFLIVGIILGLIGLGLGCMGLFLVVFAVTGTV